MDTRYYVYALLDPRQSPPMPFYVGKGCGHRAFDHLKGERNNYNPFKTNTIGAIRRAGLEPEVSFLLEGVSHQDAMNEESRLIELYGRRGIETNGILTNRIVSSESLSGHSPEAIEKIRKANIGRKRVVTEEMKANISKAARNRDPELVRQHTDRLIAMARKRKGVPLSPEHIAKKKLVKQTPESNMKRSAALKGRKTSNGMTGRTHSDETKQKMAEAQRLRHARKGLNEQD